MRGVNHFPVLNGPIAAFTRRDKAVPGYQIKAAADDSADIYFYDVIGSSWDGTTAAQFQKDLRPLAGVKTLNVFINSPGGSVTDGNTIYNILKRHKAHKVVTIDGIAASIASVIAMAGDTIKIAANGMLMIHEPWSIAMGDSAEFRKQADILDKFRDTILTAYTSRATATEAQFQKWMASETWFSAQEALDAGLVDSIVEEVAAAALSKFDLTSFRRVPDALKAANPTPDLPPSEGKPHPALVLMRKHALAARVNQPAA